MENLPSPLGIVASSLDIWRELTGSLVTVIDLSVISGRVMYMCQMINEYEGQVGKLKLRLFDLIES